MDGRYDTDEQTIQSVEDLEKLLFLWQEETDDTKQEETVHIDGELKGEYGFVFSKLVIVAKKGEKKLMFEYMDNISQSEAENI